MTKEQNASTTSAMNRDAIGLLTQDHRKAQALFQEFNRIKDSAGADEKFEIARQVCGDLLIHMEIEEAIFYKDIRGRIKDPDLMKDAESEHKEAKRTIRHLGEIDATHEAFDRKMAELEKLINHHVEDEETKMFPKVLVSGADLTALGAQLMEAKNDMRTRLGLPPEA